MEEPDFPYPIQQYSGKTKWVVLIGIIVFATLIWGIFVMQKQKETKVLEVKKVRPIEYKQLSNSITSKPIKAKKDVTIKILNGTGVTGQAGIILKALVKSGYSLSNIKLGNAEKFGHIGTTITSNADLEMVVMNIKDAVKLVFPEITDGTPNNNPNIDTGFDVVITTGSTVVSNKTLTKDSIEPLAEVTK